MPFDLKYREAKAPLRRRESRSWALCNLLILKPGYAPVRVASTHNLIPFCEPSNTTTEQTHARPGVHRACSGQRAEFELQDTVFVL